MAGQGNVFLYLVDLGRLYGGQRVFLRINLFGLQRQVELGESYWGRRCPDRLGIGNQKRHVGRAHFQAFEIGHGVDRLVGGGVPCALIPDIHQMHTLLAKLCLHALAIRAFEHGLKVVVA